MIRNKITTSQTMTRTYTQENQEHEEKHPSVPELTLPLASPSCALEDAAFPFERISEVADLESWRKEIHRPPYHIHKWWAQRLGTVFRAIIIGALKPANTNIFEALYQPIRLNGKVVFDPFMGSGTTLGEALKLGARVIGRDINPVAYFLVKNALSIHHRETIVNTFHDIERDVADKIRAYYKTPIDRTTHVDVLYFFWVKQLECPTCKANIDLFSSRIFARHAYPTRNPLSHATCPSCGTINSVLYNVRTATCSHCSYTYNPQDGPGARPEGKLSEMFAEFLYRQSNQSAKKSTSTSALRQARSSTEWAKTIHGSYRSR